MDDFDAPPDIVNAQVEGSEWALGAGRAITTERERAPWLMLPPPKKRPFNWPSGGKSPSWFNRLSRCLLEHANRYRRKIPDPTGLDGVIGNVIHGALEDAGNIRANPGRRGSVPPVVRPEELLYLIELQKDCVRQDLNVVEGPAAYQIVTTEVLARCRQIIAGMRPIKLDNIWIDPRSKKSGVEYIWKFQLSPGLLIAGIADLIQAQPDPSDFRKPPLQVVITDWKTGRGQLPSPDELALDAQAGLELCWARRAFPQTPRIRFRLYNVTLGEEVYVDWSEGLDQLMTSFASACWHLWCQGKEDATISSHCARCAYRTNCNPYQGFLRASAMKPKTGLDGQDLPALIRTFHEAKLLYDLAEARKADCQKRILAELGEQKTYRTGHLLARQKRRKQSGYKDSLGLVTALAEATNVDVEQVIAAITKVQKGGLSGFVQTLPVAKQVTARKVIDAHASEYYTKPWIEVSEKEPVI